MPGLEMGRMKERGYTCDLVVAQQDGKRGAPGTMQGAT